MKEQTFFEVIIFHVFFPGESHRPNFYSETRETRKHKLRALDYVDKM